MPDEPSPTIFKPESLELMHQRHSMGVVSQQLIEKTDQDQLRIFREGSFKLSVGHPVKHDDVHNSVRVAIRFPETILDFAKGKLVLLIGVDDQANQNPAEFEISSAQIERYKQTYCGRIETTKGVKLAYQWAYSKNPGFRRILSTSDTSPIEAGDRNIYEATMLDTEPVVVDTALKDQYHWEALTPLTDRHFHLIRRIDICEKALDVLEERFSRSSKNFLVWDRTKMTSELFVKTIETFEGMSARLQFSDQKWQTGKRLKPTLSYAVVVTTEQGPIGGVISLTCP